MSTGTTGPVDRFSRAAPTYGSVGPRHFEYFAEKLVDVAGVTPGSDVLDVATGTGAVLLAAARRLRGTGGIVGVDLSGPMIVRAAEAVRLGPYPNVEIRLMNAEQLDFADASFDYVLCSFGLSSLSDPRRAFREFRRVLRTDGRLALLDAFRRARVLRVPSGTPAPDLEHQLIGTAQQGGEPAL